MLEFIVPERGRGCDGAYGLPVLGINAQPLRFMDYLCLRTVRLTFGNQIITVPHPARFALLKLLVSSRRLKDAKRDNDLSQAERILRALFDSGEEQHVLEAYTAMPRKWRQSVRKILIEMPWADDWMGYFAEDTPYNKKY